MSLLLIDQSETGATLVTDTLVSDENLDAVSYRTKVYPLPHLNMVMAVTGSVAMADAWNARLATYVPVDIVELDSIVQSELTGLQTKVDAAYGDVGSSTIYHFGYPEGSAQLVRYTYWRGEQYASRRHVGFDYRVKPNTVNFELEPALTVSSIVGMATRLKEENDAQDTPHPTPIGGDLWATEISNGQIVMLRIHRFPDYTEVLNRIRSRNP